MIRFRLLSGVAAFACCCFTATATAQENIAPFGFASQTSTFGGAQFPASLAIDGNLGNFSHTASGNGGLGPAVWEVDLDATPTISQIVLHNRTSCCGSRLRDIVVSVHEDPYIEDGIVLGEPIEEIDVGEWEYADAVFQTELLNPENELGVFPAGPASLTIDLPDGIVGQYVRVTRVPDEDLSGSGGEGNADEADVLQLGEVEVFGEGGFECPTDGDPDFQDSHCEDLIVEPPFDGDFGDAGIYTVTAFGDDDTGDAISFTFFADSDGGQQMVVGPGPEDFATFNILAGTWTFSVLVDDGVRCDDEAADARCTSEPVEIAGSENLALGKPTAQSSQLGGFAPGLAVDGDPGNFTHTASGQSPAIWEVDLLGEFDIAFVDLFNRQGCCSSRLRDVIVSIHDVSFLNDDPPTGEAAADAPIWDSALWESPVLNPENILGAFPNGPPVLSIELDEPVAGQFVRVTRLGDPDLSGSGGQGNQDEGAVLQLGEVEIYSVPEDCPADGDSHCEDLTIDPDPLINDGDPGTYTLTAFGDDDSGDELRYTFRAVEAEGAEIVIGPILDPFTNIVLVEGTWTISVTVDDDRCPDQAADATCTIEKKVGCFGEADTHCEGLEVIPPPIGGCGFYTVTALADDDSGDEILYTFTADNGIDAPMTQGPQAADTATFNLGTGDWTISVSVDDDPLCDDVANDATCVEEIEVGECPENIASFGIADHSSQLAGFGPDLALDGNFGNFTHTISGNDGLGPAIWEVDLTDEFDIAAVVLHNRTSCCGSRLRDVIVSVHDVSFREDDPPLGETADDVPIWDSAIWESDVLNPENELGAFPLGPPRLIVDVAGANGGAVQGRFIRVTRLADDDLSGTEGQGNNDEATVLSLGEVEVFECTDGDCGGDPPDGNQFRRGDADGSGQINITDGIFILNFLFLGGPDPACADAADADDSAAINITDGIFVLNFLFLGGPDPAAPFENCGVDTTGDAPGCAEQHANCP